MYVKEQAYKALNELQSEFHMNVHVAAENIMAVLATSLSSYDDDDDECVCIGAGA